MAQCYGRHVVAKEIYVSTDIEADGKIPGVNSMLSFGSVALDIDGNVLGTFTRNLFPMEGATADPDTMAWWESQKEAWQEVNRNQVKPEAAMADYVKWLKSLPGKPVFVGYPVTYDFMFVYWYLIRFTGESPFGFQGLDIKSVAMIMLNSDFKNTTKKSFPKRWMQKSPHTHVALDDAMEQGKMFILMLREARGVEASNA